MRVLLLGGTTEANRMADALADASIDAIYSYAGRTDAPTQQPLPTRIGGFGGVEGLSNYLRHERITHVIDATHPFAAAMSRNALAACVATTLPLIALQRAPWKQSKTDNWLMVTDLTDAVAALPDVPSNIFLAIGKQHLAPFQAKPQHTYTLRLVDPPDGPPVLPNCNTIIARGPFTLDGDLKLMRTGHITWVVARNSGGIGARAKIDAARILGLPVIMIERPSIPARLSIETVADCMAWLKK